MPSEQTSPAPTPGAGGRFGFRVKRLYLRIGQFLDENLKAHGLARSQWQVLSHVAAAGTMTQKELQQALRVESATLTGIIDVLVAKGWIERLENPADKRGRLVHLTPEGVERWSKTPNPLDALEARLFAGISDDERECARDVIERMTRNLEDSPKD